MEISVGVGAANQNSTQKYRKTCKAIAIKIAREHEANNSNPCYEQASSGSTVASQKDGENTIRANADSQFTL